MNEEDDKMDILLTFTGFHDPFFEGDVKGEFHPGPILSLLANRKMDRVFLFNTPSTTEITYATRNEIAKRYKNIQAEIIEMDIVDPTDYGPILKGLRTKFKKIGDRYGSARFYISVASGTPQMHVCWFMLAASGEIPAKILQARPPKFVTKEKPLVGEIDPASGKFPSIKFVQGFDKKDDAPADPVSLMTHMGTVGSAPKFLEAYMTAADHADSKDPVLILGETGTGKERFAKFIHDLSGRKGEFIPVNCGSISESLAESILFGHKKGSFTGAIDDSPGKFRAADGGTLFLDEIGDMPLAIQVKLLRVLQEGMIEPVGEEKPKKVDVRIIAATNKNVRKLIDQDKFREDLYSRLNLCEVKLPPLRERRDDIPLLASSFLEEINRNTQKEYKVLTKKAVERLQAYTWPGNVRELESTIIRSVRRSKSRTIDADDLIIESKASKIDPLDRLPEPGPGFILDEFLASASKQLKLRALEMAGDNQSLAASYLGISPQAVNKFVKPQKKK